MLGVNKLLAFLRRQVGLRTDTASATGSLHGKLTYVKNVVDALPISPIKRIQRGQSSLTINSTTNVTITAVTLAKSFVLVRPTGAQTTDGKEHAALSRGRLTSTTNLELFSRSPVSTTGECIVDWEVVEYV